MLYTQIQVDGGTPREAWRGRVGTTALVRKLQRDSNGIFPPTLKVLAEGARAPLVPLITLQTPLYYRPWSRRWLRVLARASLPSTLLPAQTTQCRAGGKSKDGLRSVFIY